MKTIACGLVSLLAVSLVGCGGDDGLPKTVPAFGVVLLDGQPVEGAQIVAVPDVGQNPASAASDSSGRFELKAFEQKSGAVPGSYKVIVTKTIKVPIGSAKAPKMAAEDVAHAKSSGGDGMIPINDMPLKYANPTTSGIAFTLDDKGSRDLKFELSSK